MDTTKKENGGSRKEYQAGFLSRVEDTIASCDMIQANDAILVAVSGGPDSVALLRVLVTLKDKLEIKKLGVAHLNHCLRGSASDSDAEFVKSISKVLGLSFYLARENVKQYQKKHRLSLEEAAREVRYSFLKEIAAKEAFNKIALGHNSDENAELVFIQLLRGSGALGMAGIPPVRENIVRPLIHIQKTAILDYLSEKKQPYIVDMSNTDTKFLRNRIRHTLIPELKKFYNPNIIDTINRFSSIMRSEEVWIDSIIEPLFDDILFYTKADEIALDVSKLKTLHVAAKRRVVRRAIKEVNLDLRGIALIHMDAAIEMLEKDSAPKSIDLPNKIRIYRSENKLVIKKEQENLRTLSPDPYANTNFLFEYIIDEQDVDKGSVFIKEAGFYLKFVKTEANKLLDLNYTKKHVAYMDMDALKFPLIVRNTKKGDIFKPFGMEGTQKLSKYFGNNKIPRAERARSSVILSDNKIVWVVGYRMDNSVRLTSKTRFVLTVEILSP